MAGECNVARVTTRAGRTVRVGLVGLVGGRARRASRAGAVGYASDRFEPVSYASDIAY